MNKLKRVVVFGIGDFSDIVTYIIEEKLGGEIAAYTVNRCYIKGNEYHDKPLVPFEHIQEMYPPQEFDMVLGFIGKKMFQERQEIIQQIKEKEYELPNIIHPSASIDSKIIGEGNIILQHTSVEHHCKIGSGNIIWQNVVLPHHNEIGNFNNLAPSVSLSGYSKIRNHCFVGNNVCVKNKVVIGSFAYIGAGAYVSKNVCEKQVLVPNRSYILENKTGFDFL